MIRKIEKQTVMPLTKYSRYTEHIAEKALKNRIIPFPNFEEVPYSDEIWTFTKGRSTTSYQLYIQSLRAVGEILNSYRKNKKIELLKKATEIVDSWINFSRNDETDMTWYDHPTANRSQVIVDLIYELQNSDLNVKLDKYFEQLEKHCVYLMDDKNYRPNNHGLMMDRTLMIAGIALDNELFFLKGKSRAQQTFWLSYSHNGVHLENSPEYHNMVTRMYTEIEEYLNENNKTLGTELNKMLDVARTVLSELKKPDYYVPAIGDSSELYFNNGKVNWNNFRDEESGMTLIKNKQNMLYLAFICGFSTATHKHADDLSVLLNYNKKDYFVDSGKFNYTSNKNRYYVVSNKAHSSLQLDEKYIREHENKYTKEIWSDKYFDNDLYTVVSGYHNKYSQTKLRRTIYYIKRYNIIIIRDTGSSEIKRDFVSRFNLSENVKVEKLNSHKLKLHNEEDYIILQSNTTENVKVITSFDKEFVEKPVISRRSNSVLETTQLLFENNNCSEIDSIFSIMFNDKSEVDIKTMGDKLLVMVEGDLIKLPLIN